MVIESATENNYFSASDLMQYAEMLLKESLRDSHSYSWLKTKCVHPDVVKYNKELNKLKPIIQKMTSENCAKIAVKFDNLTVGAYSPAAILSTFKKLVQEQYSIQLLELNIKGAKERTKNKGNRVHPILTHDGRIPTVSFILQFSKMDRGQTCIYGGKKLKVLKYIHEYKIHFVENFKEIL